MIELSSVSAKQSDNLICIPRQIEGVGKGVPDTLSNPVEGSIVEVKTKHQIRGFFSQKIFSLKQNFLSQTKFPLSIDYLSDHDTLHLSLFN